MKNGINSMAKLTILIFFITFLTKFLGFIRDVLLSYYFGAGSITDAYLISLTIPGTLYEFVGAAIATSFIPIYFSLLDSKNGEEKTKKFIKNLLNLIVIVSIVLSFFIILFARPIVKVFASGFSEEILSDAVFFTQISSLSLMFSGCIFVLSSALQANKKYHLAIFSALPSSVITLLLIVLSYYTTYKLIGFISLITVFIQFVIILYYAKKNLNFSLQFKLPYISNNEKSMLKMSVPIFIGVSVNQINVLVDRTLASTIMIGGISIINYSNKLILFLHGSLAVILLSIIFPQMAKLANEKEIKNLSYLIKKNILIFSVILIPISILFIVNSDLIINIIYDRGAMNNESLHLISLTFSIYLGSILFLGMRELLLKICYSYKMVKIPTINSIVSLSLNAILSIIFTKYFDMGLIGLALGTTIATIFSCISLGYLVNKKIIMFADKSFGKKIYVILSIIFISMMPVFFMKFIMEDYVVLTSFISLIIYLSLLGLLYKIRGGRF